MHNQHDAISQLLARLPEADFAAVTGCSSVVDLVHGRDLAVAGDPIVFCWFPLTGLVSMIAADDDGKEAEVGVVGREGMVNSNILFGSLKSPMRILVQVGGTALRVEARTLKAIAAQREAVRELIGAYAQALSTQAAFSALAYAQYGIQKRLARWALMCGDRVGDDHIDLTHDALSIMLGVRRAGVTVALQALARSGSIIKRRGGLAISDRAVLRQIAGAGYGPSEANYERIVGHTHTSPKLR